MCVRVCGIRSFLLSSIHHVSCSMQKERQVKTTSDLFSCSSSLVLSPFHSCCSAIGVRRYFHARRASQIDYFIKMTTLRLPIHVPVTQTTRNYRIHLPNRPSHHHHRRHCHHCHHHHHHSPKSHFKIEKPPSKKWKIYRLPIIITL